MKQTFYDFKAINNAGIEISMDDFRGKTVLVVNTASKCGFTPQYDGLQKLYRNHKDDGLIILGFPCDQFAHQEPGSDADIYKFCSTTFGVTFPLFKKTNVNGSETHPLYKFLKNKLPGVIGESIKWNFTKFLIGPDGTPIKRFAPAMKPADIEKHILPYLNGGKS